MNYVLMIALSLLANFILYLAFGSLVTIRKNNEWSLLLTLVIGFFLYYTLFFVFCVPVMKFYRPMSMLTVIWVVFVILVIIISAVMNIKSWIVKLRAVVSFIRKHPYVFSMIVVLVALQAVLVSVTYNFTLDAAYYVANVGTSVDTNMMNVYDPFTGAWQDHFEMRYFFATYSIQDAIVCAATGIPPLIWTKTVMAVTIIILTNIVYYLIAFRLFKGELKRTVTMMYAMFVMNMMFNTIFTSSMFLMTRTYEGKAIVGNLSLFLIFYIFMLISDETKEPLKWVCLFIVCFGSATISSSANMLVPVEVTVLFIPYILKKKQYKKLIQYAVCVIPGVVFSLLFVLYVKGYFVFYTYPR